MSVKKILVGIDGSERGDRAREWAARFASISGAAVTFLLVIEPSEAAKSGLPKESIRTAARDTLEKAVRLTSREYPDVAVDAKCIEGGVLETIVDEANGFDLVVLGSHHGSQLGENIGGAKGLRVAISTTTPTAVIPVDWCEATEGNGVLVGATMDDSSDRAIDYSVELAGLLGQPLELVSTWGVPAFLSKPAKAMGGEISAVGIQLQEYLDGVVGRLREENPEIQIEGKVVEGSSPTRALIDYSEWASVLVLGTRTTSVIGRAIFGSLTHSVLMNLTVPTIVVARNS